MITPTQMRAARAMLDVSQGHVAEHLGIAANTLSKIESGQSDVSVSRNAEIQRFYEREGIAFVENDGVTKRTGGVETYEGRSGFLDFMDDVFETVKGGGEVFVDNVDEAQFVKWGAEDVPKHIDRMNAVQNLHSRILVAEGTKDIVDTNYAEYRYVNRERFEEVPLYIYGDKTALIVFNADDVEIFVINHLAVTNFFRQRFMVKWNKAKKL